MVLRSDLLPFEMKWSCICAGKEMCITQNECDVGNAGCCFFRTSVLGTVALVVDTVREDEWRIVVVLLLVVFSVVFAFGREPQSYLLFGRASLGWVRLTSHVLLCHRRWHAPHPRTKCTWSWKEPPSRPCASLSRAFHSPWRQDASAWWNSSVAALVSSVCSFPASGSSVISS